MITGIGWLCLWILCIIITTPPVYTIFIANETNVLKTWNSWISHISFQIAFNLLPLNFIFLCFFSSFALENCFRWCFSFFFPRKWISFGFGIDSKFNLFIYFLINFSFVSHSNRSTYLFSIDSLHITILYVRRSKACLCFHDSSSFFCLCCCRFFSAQCNWWTLEHWNTHWYWTGEECMKKRERELFYIKFGSNDISNMSFGNPKSVCRF